MTAVDATGFVLVDKEQGWTSHDVVAKVRNHLSTKVGHAGTLDPMATGLLVLGIGRATKLLRFVQGADKEYLATAQLGVATDSLDADGAVLSREPLPVSEDDIRSAMQRFTGEILQIPPMVSARKVEGTRLYELARQGKVVEREARPVTIHRLDVIDVAPSDYPEVTFRVVCSTGTYIRTLADDIGRALGGRAHLTGLRRVRNGWMHVSDASSVATIVAAADRGDAAELVIDPWTALSDMPELRLDATTEFRVRNGARLTAAIADVDQDTLVRVGTGSGELVAVYRRFGDALVPEVVLA